MLSIAKRRIERAQEYIRQGDQSLTDIADLVGYEEYAYFNRVFRKVAGSSPSQYRASFQGGGRWQARRGFGRRGAGEPAPPFASSSSLRWRSPYRSGPARGKARARIAAPSAMAGRTRVRPRTVPRKVRLSVLAGQSTPDPGIEGMIDDVLERELPQVELEWERVDWGEKFELQMQVEFAGGNRGPRHHDRQGPARRDLSAFRQILAPIPASVILSLGGRPSAR